MKVNTSDNSNDNNETNNNEEETTTNNIFNMVFQDNKNFNQNFLEKDKEKYNNKLLQDNRENDEEAFQPRKSLMQRFFSPMEEGSLRASIFAMSSLALGTGCLALPQKFGQMSFVGALCTILFAGLSAYWSLKIMIITSRKLKIEEYSKCVSFSFGKKASNFLDIVTISIVREMVSQLTYLHLKNMRLR